MALIHFSTLHIKDTFSAFQELTSPNKPLKSTTPIALDALQRELQKLTGSWNQNTKIKQAGLRNAIAGITEKGELCCFDWRLYSNIITSSQSLSAKNCRYFSLRSLPDQEYAKEQWDTFKQHAERLTNLIQNIDPKFYKPNTAQSKFNNFAKLHYRDSLSSPWRPQTLHTHTSLDACGTCTIKNNRYGKFAGKVEPLTLRGTALIFELSSKRTPVEYSTSKNSTTLTMLSDTQDAITNTPYMKPVTTTTRYLISAFCDFANSAHKPVELYRQLKDQITQTDLPIVHGTAYGLRAELLYPELPLDYFHNQDSFDTSPKLLNPKQAAEHAMHPFYTYCTFKSIETTALGKPITINIAYAHILCNAQLNGIPRPTAVLMQGINGPMCKWSTKFVEALRARDYNIIITERRGENFSDKLDDPKLASAKESMLYSDSKQPSEYQYFTLAESGRDVLILLNELALKRCILLAYCQSAPEFLLALRDFIAADTQKKGNPIAQTGAQIAVNDFVIADINTHIPIEKIVLAYGSIGSKGVHTSIPRDMVLESFFSILEPGANLKKSVSHIVNSSLPTFSGTRWYNFHPYILRDLALASSVYFTKYLTEYLPSSTTDDFVRWLHPARPTKEELTQHAHYVLQTQHKEAYITSMEAALHAGNIEDMHAVCKVLSTYCTTNAIPIIVLSAERDTLFSYDAQADMAKHLDADIVSIRYAGHMSTTGGTDFGWETFVQAVTSDTDVYAAKEKAKKLKED